MKSIRLILLLGLLALGLGAQTGPALADERYFYFFTVGDFEAVHARLHRPKT